MWFGVKEERSFTTPPLIRLFTFCDKKRGIGFWDFDLDAGGTLELSLEVVQFQVSTSSHLEVEKMGWEKAFYNLFNE